MHYYRPHKLCANLSEIGMQYCRIHVFEAAMILRAVGRNFPAIGFPGDGARGGQIKIIWRSPPDSSAV